MGYRYAVQAAARSEWSARPSARYECGPIERIGRASSARPKSGECLAMSEESAGVATKVLHIPNVPNKPSIPFQLRSSVETRNSQPIAL